MDLICKNHPVRVIDLLNYKSVTINTQIKEKYKYLFTANLAGLL